MTKLNAAVGKLMGNVIDEYPVDVFVTCPHCTMNPLANLTYPLAARDGKEKEMKYLTQFDSSGKRVTSYPLDGSVSNERYAEMLNEGFIEIDESEWNYYVGNMGEGANGTGYIRDNVTGKPSSAPPYVPSKEERLAALDSQYNADKTFLSQQYTDAMMIDDVELAAEIKTELVALNDKYDADYAAIEEGAE